MEVTNLLCRKTRQKDWTYNNKAALCINRRESGERKKRSLAEETLGEKKGGIRQKSIRSDTLLTC